MSDAKATILILNFLKLLSILKNLLYILFYLILDEILYYNKFILFRFQGNISNINLVSN